MDGTSQRPTWVLALGWMAPDWQASHSGEPLIQLWHRLGRHLIWVAGTDFTSGEDSQRVAVEFPGSRVSLNWLLAPG